jgi:hypothetical protein
MILKSHRFLKFLMILKNQKFLMILKSHRFLKFH